MMSTSRLVLSERQLCDLEMLLNGSFAPITTYLSQSDYLSVCERMELANGDFAPLPVNLDVLEDTVTKLVLCLGTRLELCNEENLPIAELLIDEIYKPDLVYECETTLGTTDPNHPHVARLLGRTGVTLYLSGTLRALNPILHSDFRRWRLTPSESRTLIQESQLDAVVGFQTRNPMHRSHMEITLKAVEQVQESHCQVGLLLTPTVGSTQECDIEYVTRVKCYIETVRHYPDPVRPMLALLPLSMRMAGPREALFHALIRRNYGCTHFIIGRDHAGPSYRRSDGSSFYQPYEAQELAKEWSDRLGIKIINAENMSYVSNLEKYIPDSQLTDEDLHYVKTISGTVFRSLLRDGGDVPAWFCPPEIVDILKRNIRTKDREGFCVYVTGLSGSGKTTLVKHLKEALLERELNGRYITVLDADVVRQRLSRGLGFSREDRIENIQRIGYVASEVVKHGGIALVANIAPYLEARKGNRELIGNGGLYLQVFVDTPLEVCERRDVKGLYQKARLGEIQLTGVNDPFSPPTESQLTVDMTDFSDLSNSVEKIIDMLCKHGLIQ